MGSLHALEDFRTGSAAHFAVLIVLAMVCVAIVRGGRAAQQRGSSEVSRFEHWLGFTLVAIWISINLRDALPGRLSWGRSLPLHVCDVVAFVAPFAILLHNRTCQSIVYFWGLGLSAQTFITPQLLEGPANSIFWQYWIYHYGIIAAAIYQIFVLGYRPHLRDWRRAGLCAAAYMLVVLPVDIRLGVNYGFLSRTTLHQPALILAMGQWPDRLPKILLCVWSLTAMMQLPWSFTAWLKSESVRDQFLPQPAV